jgi:23S rRNA (guanosine2251-2'-O)-methyltransferase
LCVKAKKPAETIRVPAVPEKNTNNAAADKLSSPGIMSQIVYTGFHTIEEKIRHIAEDRAHASADSAGGKASAPETSVLYAVPTGPRVKKILAEAKRTAVAVREVPAAELDRLTAHLSFSAQDHRGIVLVTAGESARTLPEADLDTYIAGLLPQSRELVLVLDSITDPYNIGAIIRCACQFGVSLVLVPHDRSLKDVGANETVARASAGAVSWVPVAEVTNTVQAVQKLKKAGFWIYGAEASGTVASETPFAPKTVLVMGSEGSGISRLLKKECDTGVSIPMCGKIDSLNVSAATGILLYEIYRQRGFPGALNGARPPLVKTAAADTTHPENSQ